MKSRADPRLVRVLVVDESATERELLCHVINADPALLVVAVAGDGQQAVLMAESMRPDVIAMTTDLPKQDGVAATRQIMQRCPTRIVMLSGAARPQATPACFDMLEAGALSVVGKPQGPGHPRHALTAAELRRMLRTIAAAPVEKRAAPVPSTRAAPWRQTGPVALVAIGVSTGGPPVLKAILSQLHEGLGAPIVIVQHLSPGFAQSFADWLTASSGFPVRIAEQGQALRDGVAYVAPDGMQMAVRPDRSVVLEEAPSEYGLRPSASYLFRSVATHFGARAVGVLLTGMGRDGAAELKLMREAGALTIAQCEASCVVFGMPGEAVRLDAAIRVLAPDAIAANLNMLLQSQHGAV